MKVEDGVAYEIEESDISNGSLFIDEGIKKIDFEQMQNDIEKVCSEYLPNKGADPTWFASLENEYEDIVNETEIWLKALKPPYEDGLQFKSSNSHNKLSRLKKELLASKRKLLEMEEARKIDPKSGYIYIMDQEIDPVHGIKERIMSYEESIHQEAARIQKYIKLKKLVESLENIYLPEGLTGIGDKAFRGFNSLTYIGKMAEVGENTNLVRNPTLPSSVVSIGKNAFQGCTSLTEFVMPDSITELGEHAFFECSGLQHMVISRNLTKIPSGAFAKCKLEHVIIPDSVEEVGDYAFEGCPLKSVYMSKNLKNLGEHWFGHFYYGEDDYFVDEIVMPNNEYSNKLLMKAKILPAAKKLILPQKVTEWVPEDNIVGDGKAIFRSEASRKKYCKEHVVGVPQDTTDVEYSRFDTDDDHIWGMQDSQATRDASVDSLEIDARKLGAQVIGEYAFAEQQNLKQVLIKGIKAIGRGAFAFCPNLEKIVISDHDIEFIDDYAFIGCPNLKIIVLESEEQQNHKKREKELQRRKSGKYEVNYTENEEDSTIDRRPKLPKSLEGVGDYAFSGCTALGKIVFSGSIDSIGEGTFLDSDLSEVEFKKDVGHIGNSAFRGNVHLQPVIIKGKNISIGKRAFQGCRKLVTFDLKNGLETIGDEAFAGCTSLEGGTRILETLDIPVSVTEIGKGAFSECKSLKDVILPGVKELKSQSFMGCSSLQTIALAEGTEQIGDEAFSGCESLQQPALPSTLKSIGSKAFKDCKCFAMQESYGLLATAPDAFEGCNIEGRIDLNQINGGNNGTYLNGTMYQSPVVPERKTKKSNFASKFLSSLKDKIVR